MEVFEAFEAVADVIDGGHNAAPSIPYYVDEEEVEHIEVQRELYLYDLLVNLYYSLTIFCQLEVTLNHFAT